MKRSPLLIIAIFSLFAQTAFSSGLSDEKNDAKKDFSDASVKIKFYDRTVYYTSAAQDNPVYVTVSIENTGSQTLRKPVDDLERIALMRRARDDPQILKLLQIFRQDLFVVESI